MTTTGNIPPEPTTRPSSLGPKPSKSSASSLPTTRVPDEVIPPHPAGGPSGQQGLAANVVSVPSDQPIGTVVAQTPTGGQADRGSRVRLNVSSGQ